MSIRTISIRPFIPLPVLRRRAIGSIRSYAIQTPGAPTVEVFSQHTKLLQKERAASNLEASRQVDYLRDEVASRLCERLLDIKRQFPHVLDLGANACNVARILTQPDPDSASSKRVSEPLSTRIQKLTAAEHSPTLLHRDVDLPFNSDIAIDRHALSSPETLPWSPNTFDAVLSSLSLHWINDLPSLLTQINHVLKPDAPFLGAMLGGDTLYELRTSLQLASLERRGGLSPHTSPLADVRDVGGLLQRAGFQLLTVDVDDIVIEYPSIFALTQDLQAMGESNAVLGRELGPIRREVLAAAEGIYGEMYGEATNEGGEERRLLPATFRVIYMIGWKESPKQKKPLERGTGMVSIKEVLEGGGQKGFGGEGGSGEAMGGGKT